MSEEEISLVLNTYMYLDYKEAEDGMSIREIVSELETLPDYKEGGIHHGEYTVLAKAAANPQIGNMVIDNQSHVMGYDTGTAACSFRSSEGESIYIVYRGTGDGEWPDNGVGMTESATPQQEKAQNAQGDVVQKMVRFLHVTGLLPVSLFFPPSGILPARRPGFRPDSAPASYPPEYPR